MSRFDTGVCRYCGQVISGIPEECETQEGADKWASENCACEESRAFRDHMKRINDGKDLVQKLFGRESRDYGWTAAPSVVVKQLESLVELIADGAVMRASVSFPQGEANLNANAKGAIKVTRSWSRRDTLGG